MTDQTRIDLEKAVLNFKRQHAIKHQDQGKPPMLYKDLKNILACVPKNYKRKNMVNSLFLCTYYTAQRASTMTSVKFEEVFLTKNSKGKDCVRITFNVVKGRGKHANINKNIIINEKDKEMCFINAFKLYLETEYGIDIKDFNSIRTSGKFKNNKIWDITGLDFRNYVYYTCKMSGYPKQFFSPHSIRAGVVCDMLMKAVMRDTHLFGSVFEQAKILGNWVTRSTAFSRYIKKSMLGTLIASRFVNPDQSEILIDSIITEPERFHNLDSIKPKWEPNGKYLFSELLQQMQSRLWENLITGCFVNKSCHGRFKLEFKSNEIFSVVCKIHYPDLYSTWYNEDESRHRSSHISRKIKEILKLQLEQLGVSAVFNSIIKTAEEAYKCKPFTLHEDVFLIENLKNGCFDDIQIPAKLIHELILRYKHLKVVYNNSSDSEILLHLKKDLQNLSEDDPKCDHESRKGVPYTEEEDLFIKKCYEKRNNNTAFTLREWMKKKGLKGRSYKSLSSRLVILIRMNWVIARQEKKSHSRTELTFNKNKWGKDEIEELKSQYDSKIIIKNIKISAVFLFKSRALTSVLFFRRLAATSLFP